MAKVENLNDFKKITSNITSFSHAYLFNVNSLDIAFSYVKEFVKEIILGKDYDSSCEDVSTAIYQIDNNEFDDMYVVNPSTIGINTDEINKLMNYMETKSLRPNGKRVYIIYGFERLSRDVSNKILKFLEEPSDNIYALLMTENYEKILPTIVSRCQVINLSFSTKTYNEDNIKQMSDFLNKIIAEGNKGIAYEYEYFQNSLSDRALFYEYFEIIEKIISDTINHKYNCEKSDIYICEKLIDYSCKTLINILNITSKLKCLIKGNINLNLLLDRYIIEITKELELCKKS